MKRTPTAAEVDDLKRLIKSAGGKAALISWIEGASPKLGRPRGTDHYKAIDEAILTQALDLIPLDLAQRELSLSATLAQVIEKDYPGKAWGASKAAVLRRVLDRVTHDPNWRRELGWTKRKRGGTEKNSS